MVQALYLFLLRRLRKHLIPLLLFCLTAGLLSTAAGQALETAQAQAGLSLTMGVTAGEKDLPLAEALARTLNSMRDLSVYCTFQALPSDEAEALLRSGKLTAVLRLPDHFIDDILAGRNSPPTLLVATSRPLETFLVGWLGRSAAGLLTSAQAGIYAVINYYDSLPAPPLSQEQVILGVNLTFLRAILERASLFQAETVSAAGVLALPDHYRLSLLLCLLLLLSPALFPLTGADHAFFRRTKAAGVPGLLPAALSLGTACLASWILFFLPCAALMGQTGRTPWDMLLPAGLCALVAGGLGALCNSLCKSSFAAHLLCLTLVGSNALAAGCLLPPALLPGPLRLLGLYSPITWMRDLLSTPLGYPSSNPLPLLLAGSALSAAALAVFYIRLERGQ